MGMKNIIKAVCFCTILVLFLNHIYGIFSWKDTAGDYVSSMESFYDLEEDLVDVLFLGSSRCYCSINNSVLWNEQGIASFNLAVSGQDLASSYHCLVEALTTQTPEVVCLELYGATFHGYIIESNMYRNTLSYRMSPNAIAAANSIGEDRAEELLLRWPIVHTRYRELKPQDFREERLTYIGYKSEFPVNRIEQLLQYRGDETLAIEAREEEWIRKIIALAQENDIELCFYVAPAVLSDEQAKKMNYVEELAGEFGVPVLNMPKRSAELRISTNRDFLDRFHTNYNGAKKVSKFMANYLVQNYDLQDRRGQEGYELWEEDAHVREHEYKAHMLQGCFYQEDYLNLLANEKDYTIMIATSGEYLSADTSFEEFESAFGLYGFYEDAGIWVVENRKVVDYWVGEDVKQYMELEELDVLLENTEGATDIVINSASYIKVPNGVNVVVYDKVLGTVIDAVGFDATAQYGMRK